MQERTYGERAVGLSFNTTNSDAVHECKKTFAKAIDQMNDFRGSTNDKAVHRMVELAITHAQEAQMWAVKALTWK